jgi:hypothetical protein
MRASTRASLLAVIELIEVRITIAQIEAVFHAPRLFYSWLYGALGANGSPMHIVLPASVVERDFRSESRHVHFLYLLSLRASTSSIIRPSAIVAVKRGSRSDSWHVHFSYVLSLSDLITVARRARTATVRSSARYDLSVTDNPIKLQKTKLMKISSTGVDKSKASQLEAWVAKGARNTRKLGGIHTIIDSVEVCTRLESRIPSV